MSGDILGCPILEGEGRLACGRWRPGMPFHTVPPTTTQRVIQPQMSTVPESRNPSIKDVNPWGKRTEPLKVSALGLQDTDPIGGPGD